MDMMISLHKMLRWIFFWMDTYTIAANQILGENRLSRCEIEMSSVQSKHDTENTVHYFSHVEIFLIM